MNTHGQDVPQVEKRAEEFNSHHIQDTNHAWTSEN